MLQYFSNLLVTLALIASSVTSAFGDVIADERETWARISLAGTQRMLAQQIARSTCYVMTGVKTSYFTTEATTAADAFERNIHALEHGSPEFGLSVEDDAGARQSLTDVYDVWTTFGPAARQVMAGDFHAVPVRQLIRLDGPITARLEASSMKIEDVHRDKLIARKQLASTINVASRQQMLIMKVAKLYCLIALDIDRDQMLAELDSTCLLYTSPSPRDS